MAQKLKIVIIGYYGKLNAGDDLLQHAMADIFQEHDLMFTSWFPGIDLLNLADLIVVGGGSIWPGNPFFQHGKELAKKLRTPFIVLGVSAKHSDIQVIESTKYLLEKSLLFHVRDNESKKIIGGDNIAVGADLYWWTKHHLPEAPTEFNGVANLNLRPWSEQTWDPHAIYNALKQQCSEILPMPFYFGSAIHEVSAQSQDVELLTSLGCRDVPCSFDLSMINRSSYTVAMRFHALLVSIRAGVPVIGFDYHNKTKELFKENNLEELCLPLNRPSELNVAIERIKGDYTNYRTKTVAIADNYLMMAEHDKSVVLELISNIEPSVDSLFVKGKRALKRLL